MRDQSVHIDDQAEINKMYSLDKEGNKTQRIENSSMMKETALDSTEISVNNPLNISRNQGKNNTMHGSNISGLESIHTEDAQK